MKNNITVLLLSLFLVTSLISCDEGGDPDPGASSAVDFAGEWFLTGHFPDGTAAYGSHYETYAIYNTADDNGDFWINDYGVFFELQTKVSSSGLSFSGPANADELITGGTVTISNGFLIKDGGKSTGSRTVVDSLAFDAVFDWDPGTVYSFSGHRRTGLLDDEH